MLRFLHAADIHLDSPLRGLEAYPGAPVERLRGATREALKRLVDVALAEQVAFLLIAGDLFDTDFRDMNTALFAANEMRRLESAGIAVFVILGNHDSWQEMSRRVPWPKNVRVFDHNKPHTLTLDEHRVALHGMSFPQREVRENLTPHYPPPKPDWLNVGLLHTNANGSPNHDSYAPCSIVELAAKGYDYWALGHVHDFQVLHESPHVVYSGNTQGRHARELGRKGAVLVTVEAGHIASLEFRDTDVLRWFHEIVTLAESDGPDELKERVRDALRSVRAQADGRFAAVRLELQGRCAAHRELVRDGQRTQMIGDLRSLAGEFGGDVWLEKIKLRTRPPLDLDALRQGHDLIGELLRSLDAAIAAPTQLEQLAGMLQPLVSKIGAELKDAAGGDAIDFTSADQLAAWVREAERILVDQLVELEA